MNERELIRRYNNRHYHLWGEIPCLQKNTSGKLILGHSYLYLCPLVPMNRPAKIIFPLRSKARLSIAVFRIKIAN